MNETSRTAFQKAHVRSAMEQADLRGAWLAIDLVGLAANVRALRAALRPGTRLMAVVKADAYGHGASMVAGAALQHGASALGVATVDEGVRLRRSGHEAPILVLGIVPDPAYQPAIEAGLQLTVSSGRQVQLVESVARGLGRSAEVHLKVNTGMTRVGCELHEAAGLAQYILHSEALRLTGLASHFASAEAEHPHDAEQQLRRFNSLALRVPTGEGGVLRHIANSAGAVFLPESHLDMVRVGLALYGHSPRPNEPAPVELVPVMSVRARVSQVKDVGMGARVGYGSTWAAPRATRLGLVPVGYADGLPRSLSNRGYVAVRGRLCPNVGRVSMDKTVFDAGSLPIEPGEEVTLLGGQGPDAISIQRWAEAAGTVSYEVLCGLGQRLPRVYYR
ncbi:MAG: alanine racemase [Candidatus Sericytochromatia bacterium]|nr:alanine racemase [Candidatus Sericytochromatia bacterium]